MSRILFFFSEAFRALRRNGAPTLAAVVTTVVTLVLLGVLIPIFQTAQAKSNEVRSELNVQFALYDDATNAEIAAAKSKVEAVPGVDSVVVISKQQALQTLKSELKDKTIVEELHTNPLPASLQVNAADASDLPQIEKEVMGTSGGGTANPISAAISNPFSRQQSTAKIEKVTSALKIVLTVLMALLVIASVMLVGNTIRLSIFTRRREVEVMRLVGATRWFIRWPFLIEGVVVGFLGGLIAILILWIGKTTIVDPLSDTNSFAAAQHDATLAFPVLAALLFGAAILVSTLGSGVTLRRFLRV
ncbi:MAG: cell division transport system permease protein [Solirubrobacterales bacterium]|jgi:cell division transport system permease protein|nr:cell division transport system permease protein [Solirubrobacterales bacterium]